MKFCTIWNSRTWTCNRVAKRFKNAKEGEVPFSWFRHFHVGDLSSRARGHKWNFRWDLIQRSWPGYTISTWNKSTTVEGATFFLGRTIDRYFKWVREKLSTQWGNEKETRKAKNTAFFLKPNTSTPSMFNVGLIAPSCSYIEQDKFEQDNLRKSVRKN